MLLPFHALNANYTKYKGRKHIFHPLKTSISLIMTVICLLMANKRYILNNYSLQVKYTLKKENYKITLMLAVVKLNFINPDAKERLYYMYVSCIVGSWCKLFIVICIYSYMHKYCI